MGQASFSPFLPEERELVGWLSSVEAPSHEPSGSHRHSRLLQQDPLLLAQKQESGLHSVPHHTAPTESHTIPIQS